MAEELDTVKNKISDLINMQVIAVVNFPSKQIGKIYSKTDISKAFPLQRIHINEIDKLEKKALFNTNITPTFVFYRNDKEIGRIKGYSNPEMFWWQVDEIIEK